MHMREPERAAVSEDRATRLRGYELSFADGLSQ
jgi:hypothetical protein